MSDTAVPALPPLTTRIVRGKPLRDALLAQAKTVLQTHGIRPRLVIVQVGANPASTAYIAKKLEACGEIGIQAEVEHVEARVGESACHSIIKALGADPDVDALIVQTPLPEGWDTQAALDAVPAAKDIDGLSTANITLRRAGNPQAIWPATPLGILRLMHHMGVPPQGQTVAVIGRGRVVGAPLTEILATQGATVLSIDKTTPHPATLAARADILIAAAGSPGLVQKHWLKPGAVVVDVGLTRHNDKLVGDVDRPGVEGTARMVTPSPGGVGPLTVASILTNIVEAALRNRGLPAHTWIVPTLNTL